MLKKKTVKNKKCLTKRAYGHAEDFVEKTAQIPPNSCCSYRNWQKRRRNLRKSELCSKHDQHQCYSNNIWKQKLFCDKQNWVNMFSFFSFINTLYHVSYAYATHAHLSVICDSSFKAGKQWNCLRNTGRYWESLWNEYKQKVHLIFDFMLLPAFIRMEKALVFLHLD